MTKKTTPNSKAPRAKSAATKKTTAEKKLELEAEVAFFVQLEDLERVRLGLCLGGSLVLLIECCEGRVEHT